MAYKSNEILSVFIFPLERNQNNKMRSSFSGMKTLTLKRFRICKAIRVILTPRQE